MELTEETLVGWAEVAWPEDHGVHAERLERMRQKLDDPDWRARRRVLVEDGQVRALTFLFDTEPGQLGVAALRTRGPTIDDDDAVLLDEAVRIAWSLGAERVGLRQPAERASDPLLEAIERTGGVEVGGRVEFRGPLADLPEEGTSPLTWRAAEVDEAARLLERCSVGAIDGLEPHDDADEVIASYLSSEHLGTDRAACLHVGLSDGAAVALVCAQVEVVPPSGWSTLTFMGLVPEARGRGLGPAVQRHGLTMLRAQGGRVYHGGTSLDNHAMRACFVRLGVPEHQRFREFRWRRGH